MLTNGSNFEIVLSVDVHSKGTSKRGSHCARYHRGPPAITDTVFPQLLNGHAGFTFDNTCIRIPVENPIQPGDIEYELLRS